MYDAALVLVLALFLAGAAVGVRSLADRTRWGLILLAVGATILTILRRQGLL